MARNYSFLCLAFFIASWSLLPLETSYAAALSLLPAATTTISTSPPSAAISEASTTSNHVTARAMSPEAADGEVKVPGDTFPDIGGVGDPFGFLNLPFPDMPLMPGIPLTPQTQGNKVARPTKGDSGATARP